MEPEKKGRARGRGLAPRGRGFREQQEGRVPRPGDRGGAAGGPQPSQGPPAPTPLSPPQGQGPQPSPQPQSGPPEIRSLLALSRAVADKPSGQGASQGKQTRPGDQQVEDLGRRLQGAAVGDGQPEERVNPYEDLNYRPVRIRNKKGASGKKVILKGNFYRLRVPETWRIHQYHVQYKPPIEGLKMKKGLLYNHADVIGPVRAFDGMMLFLPIRLPDDETVKYCYRRCDGEQIRIKIKFVCEMVNINPSTIQVLNVIWRKIMTMMSMQQINRHHFNTEKAYKVEEHGLEVMPGFQTSILRFESDILLDIDIAHKILRMHSVLDQMKSIEKMYPKEGERIKRCNKEIIGSVVLTKYNNKTYTVDDIDWLRRVTEKFEKGSSLISYVDYYKSQYGKEIKDLNQPLLITRAKKKDLRSGQFPNIYLVPELCILTGLTESNRTNYALMRDVATYTRLEPEGRIQRLDTFIKQVHSTSAVVQELRGWQMELERDVVTISARQLEREQVYMRERDKDVLLAFKQDEADWSRDMRRKVMRSVVPLTKWVLLFQKQSKEIAQTLSHSLRTVGPDIGMRVEHPTMVELNNDRNDTYLTALRYNVQQDTRMVLCLVPSSRKDCYDAIKKFCCIDSPVPSQVVVERTLGNKKRLMSVATKIAIQMNCKMGGVVWTCPIPLQNTMLVGFDTYHDSACRGRSVGGVVATISKDFTRYHSTVTFQTSHVELLNQLQSCVTSCINAYRRSNGAAPEKVIVFRDGVGDGQLHLVHDHEIPQIKTAVGKAKLSFVVVKKRTNARFFREVQGASSTSHVNPGPGTVIDDVATKPTWYDFFLVAQSVRQGTVTPTHYNVILDELSMLPDYYQRLAYKLTHMYYNWQGTIRVPAPCMYAHKLAFLVGQSLHTAPAASLSNCMYYL
ncbi:piwi-like protein 1 [Babylonia areolata]|uniref:piwi-like protein 1 n=1 Tax=Babylonia areolata TaxID=304850 RepID=UPI003FD37386